MRGEYLEGGSSFSKGRGRLGTGGELTGHKGRTSRRQWWTQYSKKNINIPEFLKLASQMLSLPLNSASNFSFLFFFPCLPPHWRQFVHNFLQMRWQNGVHIPKAHTWKTASSQVSGLFWSHFRVWPIILASEMHHKCELMLWWFHYCPQLPILITVIF